MVATKGRMRVPVYSPPDRWITGALVAAALCRHRELRMLKLGRRKSRRYLVHLSTGQHTSLPVGSGQGCPRFQGGANLRFRGTRGCHLIIE